MKASKAGHGARGTGHGDRVRRVLCVVCNCDFKPGLSSVLPFSCPVPRAPCPASKASR